MASVPNITRPGRACQLLLVILLTYLLSSSAGWSLEEDSSQQEENSSGHHDLVISENYATKAEGQRRVDSDGWNTPSVTVHQSGKSLEVLMWNDNRTSLLLGVTRNEPSSNIRLKRDASSGSEIRNSTETSSDATISETTAQLLETLASPLAAATVQPLSELLPSKATVQTPPPSPSAATTVQSLPTIRPTNATLQTPPPSPSSATTVQPLPTIPPSNATVQNPPPSPSARTVTIGAPPHPISEPGTLATQTTVSTTESTIPTTEPDVCPDISDVTTKEKNEGEIVVSWILEPDGVQLRNICVAVTSYSRNDVCSKDKQCVDFKISSKTVSDLCHAHEYNIAVYVQCISGEWKTETANCTTKTAVPHPPENLTVSEVSSTTMTLVWSPPRVFKGVITSYSVYFRKSEFAGDFKLDAKNKTTYELKGLSPYTNYSLKVSASTSAGEGKPSEMIQQTKEGIPDPPENLRVSEISNTTLTLEWSPPSVSKGVITKYSVCWKISHSTENCKSDVSDVTNFKLQDLDPYTNYTLMVSAWTSAGEGQTSEVIQQTNEGIPDPPGNLIVSSISNSTVTLEWSPPSVSKGVITNYSVHWKVSHSEGEYASDVTGATAFKLKNLSPYTNYTMMVSAWTSAGEGRTSGEIHQRTEEGKPSAPTAVRVYAYSNTTMTMTWEEPETPNGIVELYAVYWESADGTERDYRNSTDTNYTISDLNPFTRYNIAISAATSAGEGVKSDPISHPTDVGVPSVPLNVSVLHTNDTSMCMGWNKPEFQRGPINGFYVCWEKISEDGSNTTVTKCEVPIIGPDELAVCEDLSPTTELWDEYSNSTAMCKYRISGLDPWTNYTIEIFAYNMNQKDVSLEGPSAFYTQSTSAAVPEEPILQPVDVLNSTAVRIRWGYNSTTYPGPMTFTVEKEVNRSTVFGCTTDVKENATVRRESRKDYDSSRGAYMVNVGRLTPYTSYVFRVYASTEAGSSRSTSKTARTKPDAPGPPQIVKANCSYNPTKAFLTWRTPDAENGMIEKYEIRYRPENGKFNYEHKETREQKYCNPKYYDLELMNLHPEQNHEMYVRAKTKDVAKYGEWAKYSLRCVPPAGVPPFPKNGTVLEVKETNRDEAELAFSKTMFSEEMGQIRYYAIIVAFSHKIGKATKGNASEAQERNLPFWNQFWKQTSDMYQATPDEWNPFKESSYDPLHCQRVPDTEEELVHCTLGWEKNCSEDEPLYCNGPLMPGKRYGVKLRGFTTAGYSETNPIYIATAPIAAQNQVGTIIGVVSFVLVVILIAVAIFLEKKNNFRTVKRVRTFLSRRQTSSGEQNADIDLSRRISSDNAAKTRPMNFTTFLEHVKVMMSDSFLRFSLEYEEIKRNSPKYPCTAAEMEENRMKNRWMNIFPFDHSRVKLLPIDDEPSSDYINANYIPGFTSHREYIATQGPLPSTVDDFWRMVWEQGVTMIVMLTQCVERGKSKCEQYWPADSDNVYYGDLKLQLKSESILAAYCIRIFDLQLGQRQHTVKQMHFTKWPDFGSPESPEVLINFVQAVREHLPHTNAGPILVHCSAGVGRTGTFIAVDRLLQHIQYHNDINIYSTVVDMREHRTNMVQTEDQYIYIHKCMRDIISQRLHPRTSIYDDEDDDLYESVNVQQVTTEL